jgi:hypothetical protein
VFGSSALADEIYFKSGYSQTAVVVRETDDSITFKTAMGLSTVSRQKIDFVEKGSREENQELLKKWRQNELQEKERQEAKAAARQKFEAEQKAKGLLKFEDKWVTPAEKQAILDLRRRSIEHRRKFEEEQEAKGLVRFQHIWVTPDQERELMVLGSDIYRLYDTIQEKNQSIAALRSAMANVASMEEAEKFGERIEALKKEIEDDTKVLGRLLKKADEIEAASVRYETPPEFADAFGQKTESE